MLDLSSAGREEKEAVGGSEAGGGGGWGRVEKEGAGVAKPPKVAAIRFRRAP